MPPPAGQPKSKAYSQALPAQSDEPKYKAKYKELKARLQEIEEDNEKLQLRILKSKKGIQRLRIERSILYDRLATTSEPTNPYALKSHHLAPLPAASASQPGSALTHPDYALAAPEPVFADAVLAMQRAAAGAAERTRDGASGGAIPGTAGPGTNWGDRPVIGVAGEHEPELLAGAAARAAALQAGIGPKASALSSQAPPQQNAYASTSSSVPQQQHVQLPSALPQMPAHDMSMLPHAPPSASAYGTMNGGAGDSYALPHASSSAASPNAAAAAAAALSAASELPTVNGERMDVEAQ